MTKLLRRALAKIKKLPEDAQDIIAASLLADLADEQAWMARFEATQDARWDRIAAIARREIAAAAQSPGVRRDNQSKREVKRCQTKPNRTET